MKVFQCNPNSFGTISKNYANEFGILAGCFSNEVTNEHLRISGIGLSIETIKETLREKAAQIIVRKKMSYLRNADKEMKGLLAEEKQISEKWDRDIQEVRDCRNCREEDKRWVAELYQSRKNQQLDSIYRRMNELIPACLKSEYGWFMQEQGNEQTSMFELEDNLQQIETRQLRERDVRMERERKEEQERKEFEEKVKREASTFEPELKDAEKRLGEEEKETKSAISETEKAQKAMADEKKDMGTRKKSSLEEAMGY